MEHESALSDALLRQLIAVGQVDILVGLPTLDNAATVADVVRAVHVSFARDFPRLRTVLINSDGGSTDGTPDVIRHASIADGDTVLASHGLRTIHRVVAPYHGLPGRHSALRTILAAADLTQAKVLVIVDPGGPATTPERVTELVGPVAREGIDFLSPTYRRHPRDGLLVTQLARPLVYAAYGLAIDEPLGAEFSCSGRVAAHCLEQPIWGREAARVAIDLWLRTEAAANGFTVGQIWRPAGGARTSRATLREAVQQVMLAVIESLAAHQAFWTQAHGEMDLRTWGEPTPDPPPAPSWDFTALADQARHDLRELEPLLAGVLDAGTKARVFEDLARPGPDLDDDLWVAVVCSLAAASRRGHPGPEHVAGLFVPLYMWRAAAFMAHTAAEPDAAVKARVNALGDAFRRHRPLLVDRWTADV